MSDERIAAYLLGPGEGVAGEGADVKASRASTGGAMTLIESDADGGAPRHVHRLEDEAFYVLEGTISVGCGDETFEAGPRSFVFLPRGIPHSWDVIGDRAVMLIFSVPGGLEVFLREFHAAEGDDRSKVAELHGIEFL